MSVPKSFYESVFKENVISQWNSCYQISHYAKFTKEFFPSIPGRLKSIHFIPNFRITQFITGHGNFKAYLKRFNLSRTDLCGIGSSGGIRDVNHLILSCSKFTPAKMFTHQQFEEEQCSMPSIFLYFGPEQKLFCIIL
ncbi:hypothetical protein AVEN_249677-1 [Araneus ventricosus]|uniref:Reverse transcriptase zinc-binding domain-containing protein n=1 Tax=Araneus ventricosus TaxID=182803 RepID=A0A4Y2F8B4_ARAVE|nr:hypothetical protein AVEN_249677-1 [Araneus ventricosus]